MLLRYYRYFLVVKILLLVVGTILLWLQPPREYTGGTLIRIVSPSSAAWTTLEQIAVLGNDKQWSLPRALVASSGTWIVVHVPWTNDTWYIASYLSQPMPPRMTVLGADRYTRACRNQVFVDSATSVTVSACQTWPIVAPWIPRILVVVGIIL